MAICLFEDQLAGRALRLLVPVDRIAVHQANELSAAWRAIAAARRAGHWIALLLDYELGEWLRDEPTAEPPVREPATKRTAMENRLPEARQPADRLPRLTALVFARAEWGASGSPLPGTATPEPNRRGEPTLHASPGTSRAQHAQAIEAIRAGIARGDYYQINYTLPLWLDWRPGLDPAAVYRALANKHPVAHAACIRDGDRWILSLSPELFVARQGNQLRVKPMKGTAPRYADPARDRQSGRELHDSAKNRAENLMIVDLLRNDLGRIATPGSVQVADLFSLEAYPSVWTMTSTVTARAPNVPLVEVLRALFPCGSVTGAPKIAAMRAIHALENRRRGIYCGSVGWLAPSGDFSLNVAIRTIELRDGKAQFGVGGGIVYDSRADEEWEECLWKARILDPITRFDVSSTAHYAPEPC